MFVKCLYKYTSYIRKLERLGFKLVGEGSFRRVYQKDRIVIKVPKTDDGCLDNQMEHRAYRTYFKRCTNQGIRLAPCRLLQNGCLMMVKVSTIVPSYPRWANKVDGKQVGIYKGKVVAYDYALNLVERLKWDRSNSYFQSKGWECAREKLRKAGLSHATCSSRRTRLLYCGCCYAHESSLQRSL